MGYIKIAEALIISHLARLYYLRSLASSLVLPTSYLREPRMVEPTRFMILTFVHTRARARQRLGAPCNFVKTAVHVRIVIGPLHGRDVTARRTRVHTPRGDLHAARWLRRPATAMASAKALACWRWPRICQAFTMGACRISSV